MIGFLQLLIALGLLLFAPAGTLDYWQAWLYLCVFFGCAALISIDLWANDRTLLEGRVNAGPGAEKDPQQKRIQIFATAAFIGIFVAASADHRFGWSHVPVWAVIAGDILTALGFFIVFLTFKQNSFAAGSIDVRPDQCVVSSGPYAVVRHPMYAGALVMLVGTPSALGSWWAVVMVLPMLAVLSARLLAEERFLAGRLDGYEDYLRRVRHRLVPGLW